jgi:NAD-dependent DNA ligase
MKTNFEVTCDENGQFYVNGKPVDKRGFGWRPSSNGRWFYSAKQNVIDRLAVAIETEDVTKEEVAGCSSHEERKALWESVKARKGVGFGGHLIYLDPAASCAEAVERLSREQPVNNGGIWFGSTICFTGQMYDREGKKIKRELVRKIANDIGFVWLDMVTIGCVFLVTGEHKMLTRKTKKAVEYGTGILSPDDFWNLIDETTIDG